MKDETYGMEIPCCCMQCGHFFDLNDGYGSEKWYPGTVICKKCHRNELLEIEDDEEIDNLLENLLDAQSTVRENAQRLAQLGVELQWDEDEREYSKI